MSRFGGRAGARAYLALLYGMLAAFAVWELMMFATMVFPGEHAIFDVVLLATFGFISVAILAVVIAEVGDALRERQWPFVTLRYVNDAAATLGLDPSRVWRRLLVGWIIDGLLFVIGVIVTGLVAA